MRRFRLVCVVLYLLLALSTAFADWSLCTNRECCDSNYNAGVGTCNMNYGPKYIDGGGGAGPELINPGSPIALEGCIAGQKLLLSACIEDTKPDPSPGGPKPNAIHLNGSSVILAVNPYGQPAHRFVFRATVPAGSEGQYVLHARNGMSDPTPHAAHHRVVGSLQVNGQVVLSASQLNDTSYASDVVVTLVEGENTFEVDIHRAEGDGAFGFLTAWLDNWD